MSNLQSNHTSTTLGVLIFGCGQIGALGDEPSSNSISTHAHAISSSPNNYKLLGFVDPHIDSLQKATQRWNCLGFKNLNDLSSSNLCADLIVIASPDTHHAEHVKAALQLQHKPLGLIIEKPLSKNWAELLTLQEMIKKANTPIAVNYSRRYTMMYKELHEHVKKKAFGRFLHGTGFYSKGLLHSGSHLINAILPILNREVQDIIILASKNDYSQDDPSIDGVIKFHDGSHFHLNAIDSSFYEVFEIELFFESMRIRIYDLGYKISYDKPIILNKNTGIKYIKNNEVAQSANTTEAFNSLYRSMYETIKTNSTQVCDLDDSIKTLALCEKLRSASQ